MPDTPGTPAVPPHFHTSGDGYPFHTLAEWSKDPHGHEHPATGPAVQPDLTGESLLESIDRHFAAGAKGLTPSQMRQHKAADTCRECKRLAALAAAGQRWAAANPAPVAAVPGAADDLPFTAPQHDLHEHGYHEPWPDSGAADGDA